MTLQRQKMLDSTLAQVMTPIALRPNYYSQVGIVKATGFTEGTVSRATTTLAARDWLAEQGINRGQPGRPQKLYAPTEMFGAAVDAANMYALSLPTRERRLFSQAVEQKAATDAIFDPELYDDTTAGYLGRVVLLGERYDLQESGWFSGTIGWRSLVEIVAARQSLST